MSNRMLKRIILISFDTLAILGSSVFSYLFLTPYINFSQRAFALVTVIFIVPYLLLAFKFRMFDKINRYTSIRETLVHGAIVTSSMFFSTIVTLLIQPASSLRFVFLTYFITMGLIPGSRVFWRIYTEHKLKKKNLRQNGHETPIRTLVVGAGQGGSLFIKRLKGDNKAIEFVGLIDDDKNKQKTTLFSVPVLGTTEEIKEIVKEYNVEQITIAIPSLKQKDLERIYDEASKTDAKLNQMPSIEEIMTGTYEVHKFKEIDVTDLFLDNS